MLQAVTRTGGTHVSCHYCGPFLTDIMVVNVTEQVGRIKIDLVYFRCSVVVWYIAPLEGSRMPFVKHGYYLFLSNFVCIFCLVIYVYNFRSFCDIECSKFQKRSQKTHLFYPTFYERKATANLQCSQQEEFKTKYLKSTKQGLGREQLQNTYILIYK